MMGRMKNQIADLSRKLGYGNYASDGIKKVLGKNPINLSSQREAEVLAELRRRYAATPAGQREMDQTIGADLHD